MATIDLSQLDPPVLLTEWDLQTAIDNVSTRFFIEYPSLGQIVEGDPLYGAMVMIAKRLISMRNRVNGAAREAYLSSMTGTSIDHAGAFVDLGRLITDPNVDPPVLEADDVFKRAVHAETHTWGTGSQNRYERAARKADTRIASVFAATPNPADLEIEWLPFDSGNPIDDADIEDAIRRALVDADPSGFQIEMLTDTLIITKATKPVIDIDAHLYIEPTSDINVITEGIVTALAAAEPQIEEVRAPVPRSLIFSILDVDGVHKIDLASPITDIPSIPRLAHQWGTLTLTSEIAPWL